MPEMFRESDHPRARGGKFRAKLAARARALRRAGRAKIAAHEAKERAKIRDFDARTAEKVAAYRSANPRANPAVVDDKARAFERARGHKKRILVATLEARLKGARQRVRAAVRYEHDAGKHASDLPAMERDYERYRRRRQGMKAVGDIKAAIARAKANGPRKVDVHQDHLTGKTVSKRSKTGNPACSAAMSAWKLGRGTPEVHAMLARCRAMAAGRRQADLSRAAGNEARAQHLEHRSKQGMTGKERLAKAKELAEKRRAAQAPAQAESPKAASKPQRGKRAERLAKIAERYDARRQAAVKQGLELDRQHRELRDAASRARGKRAEKEAAAQRFYDENKPVADRLLQKSRTAGERAHRARQEARLAPSVDRGMTREQAQARVDTADQLRYYRRKEANGQKDRYGYTDARIGEYNGRLVEMGRDRHHASYDAAQARLDEHARKRHATRRAAAARRDEAAKVAEKQRMADLERRRLEDIRENRAEKRSSDASLAKAKNAAKKRREDNASGRFGRIREGILDDLTYSRYERPAPGWSAKRRSESEQSRTEAAAKIRASRARLLATAEAQARISKQRARANSRQAARFGLFGGQTPDQRPY